MDESTRRRFLRMSGLAATVGFTGCLRTLSGGSNTATPAIKDSDGDGVIDSEDYAPRDPEIQRKEQLQRGSTPTEQGPPTETETVSEPTETVEKPSETSTKTRTPSGNYQFYDGFEQGSLNKWRTITLEDPNNQNGSEWQVTRDSINGSYSAYSETNGDKNHIRTENAVINADQPFELSFNWRTSSTDSRGVRFMTTSGDIINNGENLETKINGQIRWPISGREFIEINGERKNISAQKVGQPHTVELVVDRNTIEVQFRGETVSTAKPRMSGHKYIAFNSSGHYGTSSTITIDNVAIRYL